MEQKSSDNATPMQLARMAKVTCSTGKSSPSFDRVKLSWECQAALQKGQDRPIYITITYKDENGILQHWQGRQRGFPETDILPTLLHLAEDAKKNLIPKDMTGKLRQQLADRKKKL